MNNYEIMYIVKSGTSDDVREKLIKKYSTLVEKNGGNVANIDKIGNRKFAYPIDFKNEGFYVLMNFTAKPTLPIEIERQMRINDNIVRFMIINCAGQRDLPPRKVVIREPKVPDAVESNLVKDTISKDEKDIEISKSDNLVDAKIEIFSETVENTGKTDLDNVKTVSSKKSKTDKPKEPQKTQETEEVKKED